MSRPHEKNAAVQILDEELIPYRDLPNAGDGVLESQVSAICGPAEEQHFRRVQIPVDLLPDHVAIEELDAAVARDEPGARRQRELIEDRAKSLRAGGELSEIVVAITDMDVGVLDGRHRVAAARLCGRATLSAFECVGPHRGFLLKSQDSVEDPP
jgi:hypothetical protein